MNPARDSKRSAAHKTKTPAPEQIRQHLERVLIGTWEGKGRGEFPTIDQFEYQESLRIWKKPGTDYLRYEQDTDVITPDGKILKPSHFESGVIKVNEQGKVIMASAHDSGRTEVLAGTFSILPEQKARLDLKSISLENDPRMRSSSRQFMITQAGIQYSMFMATKKTPELTFHLMAQLTRIEA